MTMSAVRTRPRAQPRSVRVGADPKRVAFLVFLFFLQSGTLTQLLFENSVIGGMGAAFMIVAGAALTPAVRPNNFPLRTMTDLFPAAMLAVVIVVSFIANQFIFGYGLNNWLLYTYTLVPVLTFYFFRVLEISFADIVAAVIIMGFLAAALILVDSIHPLAALDDLERYTLDPNARRVTILKNECVLSLLLMITAIYGSATWGRKLLLYAVPLAMLFIVLAFRFESRVALAAMLLSVLLFAAYRRVTSSRQVIMLSIGAMIGVPVVLVALSQYIEPLLNSNMGNYLAKYNVQIRIDAGTFFWKFYQQTHGVGIGLMTLNYKVRNFQSTAVDQNYYIMSDMGMFGALYQFGVVGLLMVIAATVTMAVRFFRLGRNTLHPRRDEMLMIGCFVLAFTFQPIPMNFFTLNWTVMLGGTLWYAMRRAGWEARWYEPGGRAAARGPRSMAVAPAA